MISFYHKKLPVAIHQTGSTPQCFLQQRSGMQGRRRVGYLVTSPQGVFADLHNKTRPECNQQGRALSDFQLLLRLLHSALSASEAKILTEESLSLTNVLVGDIF